MAEPYASTTHRPERKPWQGIRARLIGVLLIPTVAAMVFGGLSISRALSASNEARHAESVAQVLPESYNLAIQLMFERDTGSTDVPDIVLKPVQDQTDAAIKQWNDRASKIDYNDPELNQLLSQIHKNLAGITGMRSDLADKDTQPAAQMKYTDTMNDLFGIASQMPALSDDDVYEQIRGLSNIRPASEAFGQERQLMVPALSEGRIDNSHFSALARADAKWSQATDDYYEKASPSTRKAFDALNNKTTTNGSEGVPAMGAVMRVLKSGKIEDAHMSAEAYTKSSTQFITGLQKMIVSSADQVSDDVTQIRRNATTSAVVTAVIVLGILAAALAVGLIAARSILAPLSRLRRLAYNVANHDLPERVTQMHEAEGPVDLRVEPLDIPRRDEIGEVADAFDAVHAEAVRLAGEQAELRSNVNKMFVNLSRRSQSLVERQLQLIDQLEANEQDPDDLANLFRLDHLATRMRRNDESLLVLAGGEIGHAARGPVRVLDVLRAAASEIEQFARVDIDSEETAEFEGAIAGDLVHLLAELIENATNFSPPDTAVTIRTYRTSPSAPLLIEIEDLGIGMTPEELNAANAKLRRSSGLDADVARMMGLVVTARLAARHGLVIELVQNRPRGVVARVEVPAGALVGSQQALPVGQGQTGYQTNGELPYEMQYGMPAYETGSYPVDNAYGEYAANPYDTPVGGLPTFDAPPELPARTPGASNHPGVVQGDQGTGSVEQQGYDNGYAAAGFDGGYGDGYQTGSYDTTANGYDATGFAGNGFSGAYETGGFADYGQDQQGYADQGDQYADPYGDPYAGDQGGAPAQPSNFLSNMLPVRNAEVLRERYPDGRLPFAGDQGGYDDGYDQPAPPTGTGAGGPGQATSNFRAFSRGTGSGQERPMPPLGFGPDDDPFGPGPDAAVAPDPLDAPNPLDATTEVRLDDDEDVSPIFADLQSEWFTRRRPLGARRHMEGEEGAAETPRGPSGPPPSAGAEDEAQADPLDSEHAVDTSEDEPISWTSPGDEGWRRAAELEELQEQEPDTVTQGGLPVRVPGKNLIPGAAPAVTPPTSGPRNMDARRTRGLSSFQKGVSRARNNEPDSDDEAGSIPEGEEQQ